MCLAVAQGFRAIFVLLLVITVNSEPAMPRGKFQA